jgi:hypothetical protein
MNIEIWWIILKETDHLEDLSVVGRKILKWMLNKSIGRVWKEFIWVRMGKRRTVGNTVTNVGVP